MAYTWHLRCLLCKATPLDEDRVSPGIRRIHGDLVAMQEHAMTWHDVPQGDFAATKREPPHGDDDDAPVYRWQLPDGRWWLIAIRIEEVMDPQTLARMRENPLSVHYQPDVDANEIPRR